jgi:hypothetical protein
MVVENLHPYADLQNKGGGGISALPPDDAVNFLSHPPAAPSSHTNKNPSCRTRSRTISWPKAQWKHHGYDPVEIAKSHNHPGIHSISHTPRAILSHCDKLGPRIANGVHAIGWERSAIPSQQEKLLHPQLFGKSRLCRRNQHQASRLPRPTTTARDGGCPDRPPPTIVSQHIISVSTHFSLPHSAALEVASPTTAIHVRYCAAPSCSTLTPREVNVPPNLRLHPTAYSQGPIAMRHTRGSECIRLLRFGDAVAPSTCQLRPRNLQLRM